MADKTNKLRRACRAGSRDRGPAEDRGHAAHARDHPHGLRTLRLRAGSRRQRSSNPTRSANSSPTRTGRTRACSRSRTTDEQWLSLRYDLTRRARATWRRISILFPSPTAAIAKAMCSATRSPVPGVFRQFMQFDADTVGSASPAADAEICMMAADTMEALGIPRGSYVVKVNNRKLLDGVLEAIGLGGEANAGKAAHGAAARSTSSIGSGRTVCAPCWGDGRKDESGDFTKGAGLSSDAGREGLFGFTEGKPARRFRHCGARPRRARPMAALFQAAGYGDRIRSTPPWCAASNTTQPGLRGRAYVPIDGEDGKPVRFGSLPAAGATTGSSHAFAARPVPATGFSIGVSRLAAALTHLGKIDAKRRARSGGGDGLRQGAHRRLSDDGRDPCAMPASAAELYLGSGKMGPQLKYADKRNSPCVVIQGGDEKARAKCRSRI